MYATSATNSAGSALFEGIEHMPFRWPWQTREDAVIKTIDDVLRDLKRTRQEANEVNERVRRDLNKRMDGR